MSGIVCLLGITEPKRDPNQSAGRRRTPPQRGGPEPCRPRWCWVRTGRTGPGSRGKEGRGCALGAGSRDAGRAHPLLGFGGAGLDPGFSNPGGTLKGGGEAVWQRGRARAVLEDGHRWLPQAGGWARGGEVTPPPHGSSKGVPVWAHFPEQQPESRERWGRRSTGGRGRAGRHLGRRTPAAALGPAVGGPGQSGGPTDRRDRCWEGAEGRQREESRVSF